MQCIVGSIWDKYSLFDYSMTSELLKSKHLFVFYLKYKIKRCMMFKMKTLSTVSQILLTLVNARQFYGR